MNTSVKYFVPVTFDKRLVKVLRDYVKSSMDKRSLLCKNIINWTIVAYDWWLLLKKRICFDEYALPHVVQDCALYCAALCCSEYLWMNSVEYRIISNIHYKEFLHALSNQIVASRAVPPSSAEHSVIKHGLRVRPSYGRPLIGCSAGRVASDWSILDDATVGRLPSRELINTDGNNCFTLSVNSQ